MNTSEMLVLPMALYVFYVVLMFVRIFFRRTAAVRAGKVSPYYYKDYSGKAELPRDFLVLERHMDNQFQVPVVFFASCATFIAMNSVTMITVYLAWAFVFSRFLHSFIHLGKNKILWRAGAYGLGGFTILCMWTELLLHILG